MYIFLNVWNYMNPGLTALYLLVIYVLCRVVIHSSIHSVGEILIVNKNFWWKLRRGADISVYLILVASILVLSPMTNNVDANKEFSIAFDDFYGKKQSLQTEGGTYFGFHETIYFSKKPVRFCGKYEKRDPLGRLLQEDQECVFISINPIKLYEQIVSRDLFHHGNEYGTAIINRDRLIKQFYDKGLNNDFFDIVKQK